MEEAECESLIAKNYNRYRPDYPEEIYTNIIDLLQDTATLGIAVDVGCGTGKASRQLAKHFGQVVGIDIDKEVLQDAKYNKDNTANITYKEGRHDCLPFESSSVDLVVAASSAHWFVPIEDFFTEADRILRPGGVIAIFSVTPPYIVTGDDRGKILDATFREKLINTEYVAKLPTAHHNIKVIRMYRDFKLPYDSIRKEISTRIRTKLQDHLRYIQGLKLHQEYVQYFAEDPLTEFINKCEELFTANTEEIELDLDHVFVLIMAKTPGLPQ